MDLKKEDKKGILSFIDGLSFPMTMINKHLKDFFRLVGFMALGTSLITILMGRSSYCVQLQGVGGSFYCPFADFYAYLIPVSFLITLLCSGFVYHRWQSIISKDISFWEAVKEKGVAKDLKASLALFIYLLLWLALGVGLYVLDFRKPDPNWHNELIFFFIVSMCILLVVILLLNFVVFQHAVNGGKIFAIRKTFMPIFDNIYKLIFWFFVYFFIFIYLLKSVIMAFSDPSSPVWFNVIFGEISLYFVIYSMVAVFSAALFYQEKEIFLKDE